MKQASGSTNTTNKSQPESLLPIARKLRQPSADIQGGPKKYDIAL